MYRYVSYYRKRGKGDSCLFGAQMHLRYSRCSSPRWRKQGVRSVLVSPPLPPRSGGPRNTPRSRRRSRTRGRTGTETGAVRWVFRPPKETLTPTLRTKIGTLTPLLTRNRGLDARA
jgi:hypothetical protein